MSDTKHSMTQHKRTVYREPLAGHCRVYGEVVRLDGSREWVVSRR